MYSGHDIPAVHPPGLRSSGRFKQSMGMNPRLMVV
jgi:hypothetical protein